MSSIVATIETIQTNESLNLVSFFVGEERLSMMSLELHKSLKEGSKVKLAIKPSHIALSREKQFGLSSANQVEVMIKNIKNGVLLSSVTLNFCGNVLEALITRESQERLQLCEDEKIVAIINESELSISEIVDV